MPRIHICIPGERGNEVISFHQFMGRSQPVSTEAEVIHTMLPIPHLLMKPSVDCCKKQLFMVTQQFSVLFWCVSNALK